MFYTCIPVGSKIGFSSEMLNKSTRYFPFIGVIVGGIGAVIFWLSSFILPFQVAIALSMTFTIFITKAFHEDGFADFCDGFGGGYTSDRILEIMKDSRIGTYGAVGLVMLLLTKFMSLSSLKALEIPLIIICGHSFSRLLPVCMIYTSIYVRKDALSKSKAIGKKGSVISLLTATFFGLIPLIFLPWQAIAIIAVLSVFLFIIFRWYAKRKIGGYTGDVLGALQQLTEVTFYLGFLIFEQKLIP